MANIKLPDGSVIDSSTVSEIQFWDEASVQTWKGNRIEITTADGAKTNLYGDPAKQAYRALNHLPNIKMRLHTNRSS